jgi:hypothetical protein
MSAAAQPFALPVLPRFDLEVIGGIVGGVILLALLILLWRWH